MKIWFGTMVGHSVPTVFAIAHSMPPAFGVTMLPGLIPIGLHAMWWLIVDVTRKSAPSCAQRAYSSAFGSSGDAGTVPETSTPTPPVDTEYGQRGRGVTALPGVENCA